MRIHKEGHLIILMALLLLGGVSFAIYWFLPLFIALPLVSAAFIFFLLIVNFFIVPKRVSPATANQILCPADGKVVVIEEVEETEYFKDRRIQVSVFMSPLNVHANWNPISGTVKYAKYHPGKFLVAWHPKSSTENERTTIVIEHENKKEILFRQIAGAVARRIIYYSKENEPAQQGTEFGFIKFGSRIDVFLPLDAKIEVELNQKVTGCNTIIASF